MENNVPFTEQNQIEFTAQKKRPTLLSVLCILTFIGNLPGIFLGFFVFIYYDFFIGLLAEYDITFAIAEMGRYMFLLTSFLSALTLFSVIMMWRLKKVGFFIYTATHIVNVIVSFSIFSLIFSGIWVGLYAINYKEMD